MLEGRPQLNCRPRIPRVHANRQSALRNNAQKIAGIPHSTRVEPKHCSCLPTKPRLAVSIETTTVALDDYQPNCELSSEDELITRAQAGDADAFCLLAQAYERRIYSLALHYCRKPEDAEDLSQDVWLKAYAALSTFRREASFYTWLRRIMINCFLNSRRARSLSWTSQDVDGKAVASDLLREEALGLSRLETTLQNRLAVEKVMQVLAEVTPQQRLSFLLKHHEGMTYEEIANELGCSTGSVKKSVSRTVTRLRQRLGPEDESSDYSGAMGEYHMGSFGNA